MDPDRLHGFRNTAERYFAARKDELCLRDQSLVFKLASELKFPTSSNLVFAVPVYAGERMLGRYLNSISDSIKRGDCNVCILLNASKKRFSTSQFNEAIEYNRRVINRFQNSIGVNRVSILPFHFEGNTSMGRIRRILNDVIIAYFLEAGINNPIIVCNDVDQIAASKDYVKTIKFCFHKKTKPCFAAGPVWYGDDYISTSGGSFQSRINQPELFIFNKINSCINNACRSGFIGSSSQVWPEGANMAYAAEAYCRAGGFDPSVQSGEDDCLGRELGQLAEGIGNRQSIGWGLPSFKMSAWISTDPRRILAALLAGRTGMEAWSWKDFSSAPGSNLKTSDLARKCQKASHLISTKHLEDITCNANKGAHEFVTHRIGWNFFRSVLFDVRTLNKKQLLHVSKAFGIKVIDCTFDRNKWRFNATIDWNGSPIVSELLDKFAK